VKGERLPLDMYILLDRSGSMADRTGAHGTGPTKWDAVTTALRSFFADPGTGDLAIGMQFFPTTTPGVPSLCMSHPECGVAGPCLLQICNADYEGGSVVACASDSDCAFSDCVPMGECSLDKDDVCRVGIDPSCGTSGSCEPITTSVCVNGGSCSAATYSNPAVEITELGAAEAALGDAIAGMEPGGTTPTQPALDGAITHARTWAAAHPDHKVVAVMATDGLPTDCDVQDIRSIADLAAAGKESTPSILTFVIGVFGQHELSAQHNLDEIASSGGTDRAFFITDDQDVTAELLDALRAIQGQLLGCEYHLPVPPEGSGLDYDKVNVEYAVPGSSTPKNVFYVKQAADCDTVDGGWYYDHDPATGQTPTRIMMCPVTCSALEGVSIGGQLDIEMGCQTILAEPR